jgi:hypothetical protein
MDGVMRSILEADTGSAAEEKRDRLCLLKGALSRLFSRVFESGPYEFCREIPKEVERRHS